MELKDFVRDSIVHIIEGIEGAKEIAKKTGAAVSPNAGEIHGYVQEAKLIYGQRGVIEYITFDVAVTTVTESKKEGGAGIHVAGFGIGGKGSKGTHDSSISRLQFKVPVEYPADENRE